eukprot:bmy_08175T0
MLLLYCKIGLISEFEKHFMLGVTHWLTCMFIEQNKLKRQSHLLLQNSAPDQQLLKALDENAKLIQLLEEERIEHQQKVKKLEEQLQNETLRKEMHNLKQQLDLLEEDKKELELKYQNSEEKARNLKHSVDELQKRVNQSENSVPPPPPPPPPLPPPPPNPIRSLMSMIRKRSHPSGSGAKKEKAAQPETAEEVTDLKRQAVEEMMDRIKKGVHLRPVNQTARPKAKPESSKVSESAVNELKGILGTLNKSTSSRSLKSLHIENSETELERILRRRKLTTEADSSSPTGILATSESKSMPVLGSVSSVTKTALNKKTLEAEFNSPSPPTPEPGEGSCKLEGCTSSKVTFQMSAGLSHKEKEEFYLISLCLKNNLNQKILQLLPSFVCLLFSKMPLHSGNGTLILICGDTTVVFFRSHLHSVLHIFCIFEPTQDKVIRDNRIPSCKRKIRLCSLPQVDRKVCDVSKYVRPVAPHRFIFLRSQWIFHGDLKLYKITKSLKSSQKRVSERNNKNYLCCNATTVHCCSNCIKGLGGKKKKLLYKDKFKSFHFLSLKVNAALSSPVTQSDKSLSPFIIKFNFGNTTCNCSDSSDEELKKKN